MSNHYDLTQTDSFFNIQPVVKLFGEDIQFVREKYSFKEGEGLEIMISNNNPLLIVYDSKLKDIIKKSNSFQILDDYDILEDNKNENGENNNIKDNNNESNNKLIMTNDLETPLHEY